MKPMSCMHALALPALLVALLLAGPVQAEGLRVAVAANFRGTLQEIGREFTAATSRRLVFSSAATGTLVQQIISGARFDVLFSADARHLDELQQRGLILNGSRMSYAAGRLVLWAPHLGRIPQLADLGNRSLRVGLANPAVAPYGLASRDVLQRLDVWDPDHPRWVRGNSVANVVQIASHGLVDLALVGRSQLLRFRPRQQSDDWLPIRADWHRPLDQQAAILQSSRQAGAARALLDWVAGEPGRAIIERDGYVLPDRETVN